MGGTITLDPLGIRPGNVINNMQTQAGSTTVANCIAAINDASDATYDTMVTAGSNAGFGVTITGFAALPLGATVLSATPIIRHGIDVSVGPPLYGGLYSDPGDGGPVYDSNIGALCPTSGTIVNTSMTPLGLIPERITYTSTVTGLQVTETASQALARLFLYFGEAGYVAGATGKERIYKFSTSVVYANAPTASAVTMVGDPTVSQKPTISYTYNPDTTYNYPQNDQRIAIWADADLASYPGGRTAFEAAGPDIMFADAAGVGKPSFIASSVTYSAKAWTVDGSGNYGRTVTSAATWTPPQSLPNGALRAYVQPSAQIAGTRSEPLTTPASLAFTENLIVPAAPTSVTPVWSPLTAKTSVTVAYPAQTLGGYVNRKIIVERQIAGGSVWRMPPIGTVIVTGAAAGSAVITDTFPLPNKSVTYRARIQLGGRSDGATADSASTVAGAATVQTLAQMYLVNPLDTASAPLTLHWQGNPSHTKGHSAGIFRGLGQPYPTIITDSTLSRIWKVQLLLASLAEGVALSTLRDAQTPLLLLTDQASSLWAWVRISPGDDVSHELLRQPARASAPQQFADLTLVECKPLPGQPQVWTT